MKLAHSNRRPAWMLALGVVSAASLLACDDAGARAAAAGAQRGEPNAQAAGRTELEGTALEGTAPLQAQAGPLQESTGATSAFADDELAIDLRDDQDETAVHELEAAYGVSLSDNSPDIHDDGHVYRAHVARGTGAALLARLSADPRVEAAEPLSMLSASFVPNDPQYGEQWHLKRVGAEQAWESACGKGVTVAVIDTGVACYDKGPFMKGSDLQGTRCVAGYNFVSKNTDAVDDHGHGTHVAGTIAQTTNNGKGVAGLAYCANLMPIKVLSGSGSGTNTDVAEGIRFAADHGAHVINLSLGGPFPSLVIKNAVNHALAKGVIVVAAAGNSGRSVGYPAAYPGVIAVSASDRKDEIAWFSSRGPQVTIAAPGVAVMQQTVCEGGKNKCEVFGVFNGTSMASPHVAGAAALLVGDGVTSASSVQDALTSAATPKADKNLFGAGILNADAALARVARSHLLQRAIALAAFAMLVASYIRRKRQTVVGGAGRAFGALLFGIGLLPFASALHLHTLAGPLRWATELLARPVGEWDIALFGPSMRGVAALATALPAVGLVALFFSVRKFRGFLGGACLGSAALATQLLISRDVAVPLGSFGLAAVLLPSIALCLVLARLTLAKDGHK